MLFLIKFKTKVPVHVFTFELLVNTHLSITVLLHYSIYIQHFVLQVENIELHSTLIHNKCYTYFHKDYKITKTIQRHLVFIFDVAAEYVIHFCIKWSFF